MRSEEDLNKKEYTLYAEHSYKFTQMFAQTDTTAGELLPVQWKKLQTHGTAMGTKVAVSFANIFMPAVETEIINKSKIKPLEWKRYIDDVFSLWDTTREEIDRFILAANRHHPAIHLTAEISEKKTKFLDTTIF